MKSQPGNGSSVLHHGISHIGLKRSHNEDCYVAVELGSGSSRDGGRHLLAVADGIGGHACGDVASRMACSRLTVAARSGFANGSGNVTALLKSIFLSIDSALRGHAFRNPECEDMGTTLSCLLMVDHSAAIAHVGDSRIYRMRGNRLEQLTTDHSFVQELIDWGELKPEHAKSHPLRSVLTRAIGTREPLTEVDTAPLSLWPGDRYLLCSDGLHDMVAHSEIASIMCRGKDPAATAEELLSAAMRKGGKDNVTVVTLFI